MNALIFLAVYNFTDAIEANKKKSSLQTSFESYTYDVMDIHNITLECSTFMPHKIQKCSFKDMKGADTPKNPRPYSKGYVIPRSMATRCTH